MCKQVFFAFFLFFSSALTIAAKANTIYVAPDGDDNASGSFDAPLATLPAAYQKISGGDTVYFRGGIYRVTDEQVMKIESLYAHTFALEKAGTKEGHTCFMGYPGERPIFDFSALQLDGAHRFTGFYLGADYIHLRNFDIIGLPVRITGHTQSECVSARKGSHCIVENIAMYNNMAIGYYQTKGSDNLVLNCDAYNNYDDYSEGTYGGNVDGFGIHVSKTSETGNRMVGCRAWRNSDDGFDLINCATAVEISHCMAFFNGYQPADDLTTFKSAGDGNGFKAGGWGMSASVTKCPEVCPSHYVHHCLAYKNKANGFYSNHHLAGNTWEYNSASENRSNYEMVNRYANTAEGAYDVPGYNHVLRHNVSWEYRDKGHLTNYDTETCTMENNSFLPEDSAFTVTADMFVSTDVAGLIVKRNADGTLPEIQFMRGRENSAPANRQMGWQWEEAAPNTIQPVRYGPTNDGILYDLTGRVVDKVTRPGIYIRNNKKVFLKRHQ